MTPPAPPALGRVRLELVGGPRDGELVPGVATYRGWNAAEQLHEWEVRFPAELLQLVAGGGAVAHMDRLPGRTGVAIVADDVDVATITCTGDGL